MTLLGNTRNNHDIEITIIYGYNNETINVKIFNDNKIIKCFTKGILKDEIIIVDENRINLGRHIFDNFDKYTQLSIIDYDDQLPILITIQNNEFLIKKINNTYIDRSVYDLIEDIGLAPYPFEFC